MLRFNGVVEAYDGCDVFFEFGAHTLYPFEYLKNLARVADKPEYSEFVRAFNNKIAVETVDDKEKVAEGQSKRSLIRSIPTTSKPFRGRLTRFL